MRMLTSFDNSVEKNFKNTAEVYKFLSDKCLRLLHNDWRRSPSSVALMNDAFRICSALNDNQTIILIAELIFDSYADGPDLNDRNIIPFKIRYASSLAKIGLIKKSLSVLWPIIIFYPNNRAALRLFSFIYMQDNPRYVGELLLSEKYNRHLQDIGLRLICAECLNQIGESNKAIDLISQNLTNQDDPDDICGFANANINLSEKIKYINKLFHLWNLVGIEQQDNFAFGDINARAPRARDNPPLISIVMTTFNSELFVRSAVKSLLNQDYPNIEIIVVDDCSDDNTVKIIEDINSCGRDLRIIRRTVNSGTYNCKNFGIIESNGAFVTCHDSDDWAHPQKISREFATLTLGKCLAVTSNWIRMDDGSHIFQRSSGRYVHINPASVMFRKKEVLEHVGLFQAVRAGADTEFRRRITAAFGDRALLKTEAVLAIGRIRGDSLTRGGETAMNDFGTSPLRAIYSGRWIDVHVDIEDALERDVEWKLSCGENIVSDLPGMALDRTAARFYSIKDIWRHDHFARLARFMSERDWQILKSRLLMKVNHA